MGKADAPRSGNPFLMQDMVIEMNSFTAFSFGVGPPPAIRPDPHPASAGLGRIRPLSRGIGRPAGSAR